jgi:hypothetical protein
MHPTECGVHRHRMHNTVWLHTYYQPFPILAIFNYAIPPLRSFHMCKTPFGHSSVQFRSLHQDAPERRLLHFRLLEAGAKSI